jgi:DNA replication protein DnaC
MDNVLIAKKLERLNMSGMAETLEQRLKQSMEEKWSYSMFLEALLTDEIERRDHKQLKLRLAKSRLDLGKTMETFDFAFNPMIPVSVIRELSSCQFIEKKNNIFILGPSGVGKSHIAQALGHEACRRGQDVLFYCTYQLLDWIYAGRGDGTQKKRLAQILRTPLLILDDWGLQALNETQQEDLYQLIAERYEKRSTILTSNRDVEEWSSIFASPLIGMAAVDRLVHRGIKITIEKGSYRLAEFKKNCAKTKKSAIIK